MKLETVKVKDLVTPSYNTRIHPDKQVDELCKSYELAGQLRPFVIDENNNVLAGNGLLAALRKMGVEEASAYRLTGLTESQKKKIMLADNKTFALGFDNLSMIDDVMKTLDDFEIPGYDSDTLAQLYADEELTGSYGVLEEDKTEAYVEAQRKEEQKTAEAVHVEAKEAPPAEMPVEEYERPAKQEVRKFVLCPKCGEKIWL